MPARGSVDLNLDDEPVEECRLLAFFLHRGRPPTRTSNPNPSAMTKLSMSLLTLFAAARLALASDLGVNEAYKANADWWKDPLALFDEDDDEVVKPVVSKAKKIVDKIEAVAESEVSAGSGATSTWKASSKELTSSTQSKQKSSRTTGRGKRASSGAQASSGLNLALLPAALPKLQSLIMTSTTGRILALVALGKIITEVIRLPPKLFGRSSDEGVEYEEDYSHMDVVPPETSLEIPAPPETASSDALDSALDEQDAEEDDDDEVKPGWFGRMMAATRMPSARVLVPQLEQLRLRCEHLETERNSFESAYEKTSMQLQQTSSELQNLQTTTRFLQTQLEENEEMLETVIRDERAKAKDELLRMKQAMLKVVERERESMREEFLRQAAQLQELCGA